MDNLDPFQSTFSQGRLETALVALVDDFWWSLDGGDSSILVLLDLSVALESINYCILLVWLGEWEVLWFSCSPS